MTPFTNKICWAMLSLVLASGVRAGQRKEFLTPDEIEKIQDAQEVDARVKIYLQAASLRLKTAMDRMSGKESAPGDPLEFFSVEDMLDGYYRILQDRHAERGRCGAESHGRSEEIPGCLEESEDGNGGFPAAATGLKSSAKTRNAKRHGN